MTKFWSYHQISDAPCFFCKLWTYNQEKDKNWKISWKLISHWQFFDTQLKEKKLQPETIETKNFEVVWQHIQPLVIKHLSQNQCRGGCTKCFSQTYEVWRKFGPMCPKKTLPRPQKYYAFFFIGMQDLKSISLERLIIWKRFTPHFNQNDHYANWFSWNWMSWTHDLRQKQPLVGWYWLERRKMKEYPIYR